MQAVDLVQRLSKTEELDIEETIFTLKLKGESIIDKREFKKIQEGTGKDKKRKARIEGFTKDGKPLIYDGNDIASIIALKGKYKDIVYDERNKLELEVLKNDLKRHLE